MEKMPLMRSNSDPSLLSSESAQHAGSFTRQKTEALNRFAVVASAMKQREVPKNDDDVKEPEPVKSETEVTTNVDDMQSVAKITSSNSSPVISTATMEITTDGIRARRASELEIRKFIQDYKDAQLSESDLSIIRPDEVTLEKELGRGSFGTVYAGICRSQKVAIKLLHDQNIDESALETFRNEVSILSTYHHPNIILYMGACTVPNHLMIVMERMVCNLEDLLLGETKLSLLTRLQMAKGCALGMNWLHSANPMIIHRDLKPENILVDENLRVVITDFGLSERLTHGTEGMDTLIANGAITYISPEVLKGTYFTEKIDIYSFALILLFIHTRKKPYDEEGFDSMSILREEICFKLKRPEWTKKETEMSDGEKMMKKLIEECWDDQPSNRPSFSQIISRLDDIYLQFAIEDPQGRDFWRVNFGAQEKVDLPVFMKALAAHLNCPELLSDSVKQKVLQIVLINQRDGSRTPRPCVTVERFGNMLCRYGSLVREDSTTIVDKIKSLMMAPWFHGEATKRQSIGRLLDQPVGTFLIICGKRKKAFILFYVDKHNKVRSESIFRVDVNNLRMSPLEDDTEDDDDNNEAEDKEQTKPLPLYGSIHELIEANKHLLRIPCAGSELSYLFGDNVGKLGHDLDSSSDEESSEEDTANNSDSESDDEYSNSNDVETSPRTSSTDEDDDDD
eukprot:TRINITY_DN16328_c0_g1_i1.p1 TRINITY_DN16328_c0_g1~~TRINITY_DN16328_c0_g1_i1.p1  ORF type:complete len:681 (-),score=162.93 TRINITY_DN16328_c0_g1_i1:52-2094(-)